MVKVLIAFQCTAEDFTHPQIRTNLGTCILSWLKLKMFLMSLCFSYYLQHTIWLSTIFFTLIMETVSITTIFKLKQSWLLKLLGICHVLSGLWKIFAHFKCFNSFIWTNWFRLDQIGLNWIRLDQTGSTWHKLDQIGINWIKLDKIGSNLSNSLKLGGGGLSPTPTLTF